MENDYDLSPNDFYDYAESNKKLWGYAIGQRITHDSFGTGAIESLSNLNEIKTVKVKFDKEVESQVNGLTDTVILSVSAFQNGHITDLSLSSRLVSEI